MSGKSNKSYLPLMQEILDGLGVGNLAEFSRLSGIPRSTLDRYAVGERVPTDQHLATMAKLSKLSITRLRKDFEKAVAEREIQRLKLKYAL